MGKKNNSMLTREDRERMLNEIYMDRISPERDDHHEHEEKDSDHEDFGINYNTDGIRIRESNFNWGNNFISPSSDEEDPSLYPTPKYAPVPKKRSYEEKQVKKNDRPKPVIKPVKEPVKEERHEKPVKTDEFKKNDSFFLSVREEFGHRINVYDSVLPHYAGLSYIIQIPAVVDDIREFDNEICNTFMPYIIMNMHPTFILTDEEAIRYFSKVRINKPNILWFHASMGEENNGYFYAYRIKDGFGTDIKKIIDRTIAEQFGSDTLMNYSQNYDAKVLYESTYLSVVDQLTSRYTSFLGAQRSYVEEYRKFLAKQVEIKYGKKYDEYVDYVIRTYEKDITEKPIRNIKDEYELIETLFDELEVFNVKEVFEDYCELSNNLRGLTLFDEMMANIDDEDEDNDDPYGGYGDDETEESESEFNSFKINYSEKDPDETKDERKTGEENEDVKEEPSAEDINQEILNGLSRKMMGGGLNITRPKVNISTEDLIDVEPADDIEEVDDPDNFQIPQYRKN